MDVNAGFESAAVDCGQYERMLDEYSEYLQTADVKLGGNESMSTKSLEEMQAQQESYNVGLIEINMCSNT